jgi:non-heme chloroperoxidase
MDEPERSIVACAHARYVAGMTRIVTRDGHSLFVRDLGRGAPCLLVHGFASDSRSWLPFVAPLLHRHRFIIPDLRGFGGSHHVPLEQTCPLTHFTEDLEDVLDALDLPSVPVVGISMGAFTTLHAFRRSGGARFSRVMHIDQGPVIKNHDDYAHGLMGSAQTSFFARLASLLTKLDAELMTRSYENLPPDIKAELWQLMGEFSAAAFTHDRVKSLLLSVAQREPIMRRLFPVQRWQVYIQIVRAYLELDYDLRDGFRAMKVPLTVLIGGGSSMYPPAGQRAIAELAPHANIREIPHAGHMLPYEAPRLFMRELRAFLAA